MSTLQTKYETAMNERDQARAQLATANTQIAAFVAERESKLKSAGPAKSVVPATAAQTAKPLFGLARSIAAMKARSAENLSSV